MIEFYLDVDGVILDFESSFVDYVRENYIPNLPQDYILQTWEMSEEFSELDIEEVWNRFVNSDKFQSMKLLADQESFNRISSLYPLYLITNLPNAQYEGRKANLDLHGLNYTGLYLAGHFNFGEDCYPTKSDVIKRLHKKGAQIIFLDDHPKNCTDILDNIPESRVFLMERPHNKGIQDNAWTRVKNWNAFYRQVSEKISN